jgi:hypothetical protein
VTAVEGGDSPAICVKLPGSRPAPVQDVRSRPKLWSALERRRPRVRAFEKPPGAPHPRVRLKAMYGRT